MIGSHPSRDAWIEIFKPHMQDPRNSRRIPRGMRGLKFYILFAFDFPLESHPSRDAWIEIPL